MGPSSTTVVGVKDVLLWSLLLPAIGALQQQPSQHAYHSRASADELSSVAASAAQYWRPNAADSLQTPPGGYQAFRDTHVDKKNNNIRTHSSHNERALATLSSAESNPVVRAPPAVRSSASAGGLSSRLPARSLQDWKVEDIVLLATVDGNIYARDRKTGAAKWQLETDRPMVETVYHRHNRSTGEEGQQHEDPLWIVEPSEDGSIYVYFPGNGYGMQKLPWSVKDLAELGPWASDGYPEVAYTAEKRSTLYTIDAATGNVLKSFSSAGYMVNDDRSCKKVNPLESLDDEECEPRGTLTIGRTDYVINVQDRQTTEPISTIKYFEWGPNNRDQDLKRAYHETMDNRYVYTRHDGSIFGLNLESAGDSVTPIEDPRYHWKLSSPVARVYDLVRPYDDVSTDASLVVLPQPLGRTSSHPPRLDSELFENIFVNCIDNGSCYALSEANYPTVTEGASLAQLYGDDLFDIPLSMQQRQKFTGVHHLTSSNVQRPGIGLIDSPDHPLIEAPLEKETKALIPAQDESWSSLLSVRNLLMLVLAVLACGVVLRQRRASLPRENSVKSADDSAEPVILSVTEEAEEHHTMVRESEPALETIFSHGDGTADQQPQALAEKAVAGDILEEAEDKEDEDDAKDVDGPKPAKKKATRGKRGGKKQKAKEQEQAQAQAQRKLTNPDVPQPAEVISVAASESPQVSGPLQINSLIIHTDKVIGQGSCGTSVFEGSFEGRDVAVKRMLSQYYELASQEVSFLQQSDDHANVIRYFCQQKDDHFLYIAVELCQASLFEVWEVEKAKTEARRMQLSTLKHTIQQDVPKALQQLAAGLYHLHNLRIIHRDIKPQNILVAFPKPYQNGGPRLVISDFGLGKNLPENVSTLVDPTGNAGTSGWKAPELISQPKETDSRHSQSNSHTGGSESANGGTSGVKRAADIFSLGCLFFWVLTDGIHPYEDENGWHQMRELNIKRDYKKMDVLARWSDAYEPMQLITSMLAHQPENRPTALQVLNHPFFWTAEKRLAFLCDCSDHFEREPRGVVDDGYLGDSESLQLLEMRAEEVIGAPYERADFLARLDRHFVDTLGRQRKYSGNRLLDLLRALRNKKNHYEDMPEDVKKRVGPLSAGYLSYWCNRFPRLLMACYEVVHEVRVQHSDRFKGYFVMGAA